MTVTIDEKHDSRETTAEESISRTYIIRGTDSDIDAMTALVAEAPTVYNGMTRGNCSVEPQGGDLWIGTAPYTPAADVPPPPLESGESEYDFDTGGGVMHVTQAKAHIVSYAPPGEVPGDHGGAIGVTGDGVDGVDIVIPSYRWSERHAIASGGVTNAYKYKLFSLTGKTNDAPFRGFATGEVLFLGASGSQRGDGDWEITINFAAQKNQNGLSVGAISGIIDVQGWEYMWVRYEDVEDTAASPPCMVSRPVEVHVERVYDAGDFGDLEP